MKLKILRASSATPDKMELRVEVQREPDRKGEDYHSWCAVQSMLMMLAGTSFQVENFSLRCDGQELEFSLRSLDDKHLQMLWLAATTESADMPRLTRHD